MRCCTIKCFIGCALKMCFKSPKNLRNAPKVPLIKLYFLCSFFLFVVYFAIFGIIFRALRRRRHRIDKRPEFKLALPLAEVEKR